MMKEIDLNLKNKIEELYSYRKSMRYVSRTLKVGIKTVRTILLEKGYIISSYERPFDKIIDVGTVIGRWIVIGLPIKDNYGRYVVPVQCECGTRSVLRPSAIFNGTTNGCKHCVNKNNYPTFRKSRCNPDLKLEGL